MHVMGQDKKCFRCNFKNKHILFKTFHKFSLEISFKERDIQVHRLHWQFWNIEI
jgi:hypothetical protein